MRKVFIVKLREGERVHLQEVCTTGTAAASAVLHARILLKADQSEGGPGWIDARICEALDVSRATVERVRERYVLGGVDDAVLRRRRPAPPRKLDGAGEAHLIATACSAPPAGHTRWTLRLLAGKLVELEQVDTISHETVRQILKKTRSSRG
jgi:transposase